MNRENTLIVKSKLTLPQLGTRLIDRPRLIERLLDLQHQRVILITAPAGYGKTVLLLQIIKYRNQPTVWYQLDEYDNDPAVFLQYLIAGIRQYHPGFGECAEKQIYQKHQSKAPMEMAAFLTSELESFPHKELLIAIDDYHLITEPSIHHFMNQFIAYLPPTIQLVISSRPTAPWYSSRAEISGLVAVIETTELCFSKPEMVLHLSQTHPNPTPQMVDTLAANTNGWPLAVALFAKTIPDEIPGNPIETPDLDRYFNLEVFQQQPELVRQFLLAASVLEEITPKLCNWMLQRDDSAQILKTIAKEQLFLTTLAGKDDTYYLHPLFRDFLNRQLGPGRRKYLQRAGEAAAESGEPDRSVEYYLAAEDFETVSRLIIQRGKQAIRLGRWQTVSRWLDFLPRELVFGDPWLLFFRSEILINRGQLAEAQDYLEKIETGFKERQDSAGISEVMVQKARIRRINGHFQESLKLLDQAIPNLVHEKIREHFHLTLEKSLNLSWSGKLSEAEDLLKQALQAVEPDNDGFVIAQLAEGLGNIYFMKGDFSRSMEYYRRSETAFSGSLITGYLRRNNKAAIYLEWGEVDQALEFAQQDVALKERLGWIETLPLAYLLLGLVNLERQDMGPAEEYLRRTITTVENNVGDWFFLLMSQVLLARLLCMQNRLTEARLFIENALREAGEQSNYALAVYRIVSLPYMFMTGELEQALRFLPEAIQILETSETNYFLAVGLGSLAGIYFGQGNITDAAYLAERCLKLAARGNYIQFWISAYPLVQSVLHFGLEQGIEIGFIQRVLVHNGQNSLNLLQHLVKSPVAEVRRRVIIPLLEIGGPEARQIVIELQEDPEAAVREQAKHLIVRFTANSTSKSSPDTLEPLIQISSFGSLRIFANRTEITTVNWRMKKTRDLLIYLSQTGEPVDKSKILEDLWPEFTIKQSSENFHTALHYLRQLLRKIYPNQELVIYGGGKYQLRPLYYQTDKWQFEFFFNFIGNGSPTTEQQIMFLEKAVELYRGDYLEDLDYDWIIPERERLRNLYLGAQRNLAEYYCNQGDPLRAIFHLRNLMRHHPFSEEFAVQLMTAYSQSGNLAHLNEFYQQFTGLLRNELGIEPSAELQQRYSRLIIRK